MNWRYFYKFDPFIEFLRTTFYCSTEMRQNFIEN